MKKKGYLRLVGLVVALAFLISSFIFYRYFFVQSGKKSNQQTSVKEISYYKNQINLLGAKQAYAEFKQHNKLLKTAVQHDAAHFFGEALYLVMGIEGITVCDSEFNFGCYHSVIGNTLARQGLGTIEAINQSCMTTADFLKCQHGIGHGVVAFLGYDFKDLKQALTICDSLQNRNDIGGCFTGAFMEYNFQTMLADDAKIRKLNEKSPLYPCNELSENFQPPCLYEQPNWWLKVLSGSLNDQIAQIDEICHLLPSEKADACFTGLGVHLPTRLNWDIPQSAAACLGVRENSFAILCLSGAASDFYSRPEYASQAAKLCSFRQGQEKSICLERAGIQ